MRYERFLIATLAVAACSVDHVVVAEIVDAGSASPDDVNTHAGSAGLIAGGAANVSSGGFPAQGGDKFLIGSGGASVDLRIDGVAGAATKVLCSCKEDQAVLCGSDGVTYPFPASCADGGMCQLPTIACGHACPCLDPESTGGEIVAWFSADCMATIHCIGEAICLQFRNVTLAPQDCADAGI